MSAIRLRPRVLFLTEDREMLRRQLVGEPIRHRHGLALMHDVSTDEITPAHACYFHDERLAERVFTGLRGGVVKVGAVARSGFSVVVSGRSKGCGSSRETAPYAEHLAGIRLVIAESFEKIYRQNCENIGLLTSTDFSLIERIERGEAIPLQTFTRGLDSISRAVVESGGLFAYSRSRLGAAGAPAAVPKRPRRERRPMTFVEKCIAVHAVTHPRAETTGVETVCPGDALFVRADVRFSHDYVTAMADALFRRHFGEDARVAEPESVYAFRDHLTLLDQVMPEEHRRRGLDARAAELATVQQAFTRRHGIRLFGEVRRAGKVAGSEGICHNTIVEDIALPGQIVVGTDSHTCTAGALGCLAFGVGSTDMACAWLTRDVRIRVPETVRVSLKGRLRPSTCAKDVMLHLLGLEYFRSGQAIGRMLELGGDGLATLPLDERATLTNMAVEAGALSGVTEPDETVIRYLVAQRGLDADSLRARIVRSDPGARYAATFEVDLGALEPMVALPGDPRSGRPLSAVTAAGAIAVDIAYGGSCTGGKRADMDLYAAVLRRARDRGLRVSPGVRLYIQFGSQKVRRYAEERGYLDLFEAAGAHVVEPSCGACIRAGPGVSSSPDQVTVSATNRNFPGRSGPGRVYLASPLVVAASAIAGKLTTPEELFGDDSAG